MKFNPFPIINTERLSLRKTKESDSDIILYLRSDETINKYIERPENRKTKNKAEAIKFINGINEDIENGNSIFWGIALLDDPKIVGSICLWNFSTDNKRAEVGYNLIPEFQKKGLMIEALQSVIKFGFNQLQLTTIEAYTHVDNNNSTKLLKKNGFHLIKNKTDLENKSNIIFEIKNSNINPKK